MSVRIWSRVRGHAVDSPREIEIRRLVLVHVVHEKLPLREPRSVAFSFRDRTHALPRRRAFEAFEDARGSRAAVLGLPMRPRPASVAL